MSSVLKQTQGEILRQSKTIMRPAPDLTRWWRELREARLREERGPDWENEEDYVDSRESVFEKRIHYGNNHINALPQDMGDFEKCHIIMNFRQPGHPAKLAGLFRKYNPKIPCLT
jgi:hypothetical protein